MVRTHSRKRIEILVDLPLLRRIRMLAQDVEIGGHTIQRVLEGSGEGGRWTDDRVTGGAGSKVVFSTIVDEESAERFLTVLEPLLEEYGLMVTLSTVEVIRAERF